jgi:serine/threonine protein kinase
VVTELVEGNDCQTPLEAGRRMSLEQVVALGKVLAGALGAVHGKGLVHGAVQPSNIVFSGGAFKLTDLGLGRLARERAPTPYRPAGSVGSDADIRAVVAVLYHLYTGRPAGGDPVQPPGQLRSGTPEGFDRLVARGLSARRAERFSSAEELAAGLAGVGE